MQHSIDLGEVELHAFHWDNFDRNMLAAHQRVMQHLGLEVRYWEENIAHGQWLDRVVGQARSKVIGIIEPDLIPLSRQAVQEAADYAWQNDSFIGCAQASNHIHPASHIFASPAFFFITPSAYARLGRPSFMPNKRGDVAEALSFIAERRGIRYRTLFPTCFEREPREGAWPLGSYGLYGVGTVFADRVYHLFQSRYGDNAALFVRRCDELIAGSFSTAGFHDSRALDFPGRVVPVKRPRWYLRPFM